MAKNNRLQGLMRNDPVEYINEIENKGEEKINDFKTPTVEVPVFTEPVKKQKKQKETQPAQNLSFKNIKIPNELHLRLKKFLINNDQYDLSIYEFAAEAIEDKIERLERKGAK